MGMRLSFYYFGYPLLEPYECGTISVFTRGFHTRYAWESSPVVREEAYTFAFNMRVSDGSHIKSKLCTQHDERYQRITDRIATSKW